MVPSQYEKELAAAALSAERIAAEQRRLEESINAQAMSFEKQGAMLIQAMQSTQKNLLQTFTDFQTSFKKFAEDLAGK